MPPRANDGKVVVRQAGRVLFDKRLDQIDVCNQGVTDLEPDFRRQGSEFFRGGDVIGNHLETLVHEEHQRPVQPEKQFDILKFEQHRRSPILMSDDFACYTSRGQK